ncbi:MAG: hypothetical protein RLZZ207_601 [Bacteroidota bacterium]
MKPSRFNKKPQGLLKPSRFYKKPQRLLACQCSFDSFYNVFGIEAVLF